MRVKWNEIIQGFIVAALLGIMGAAISTWVEVKMLRHDVQRIEGIIDNLVDR